MPMRRCALCGGPLPKNSSGKRRYCSDNCRKLASKRRLGAATVPSPPAGAGGDDTEVSYADLLRVSLDALRRAVQDPDTPAQAIAALTKQMLAVGKEINALEDESRADPLAEGVRADDARDESFDPGTV